MKTELKDVAHLYKGFRFLFENEEHESTHMVDESVVTTEADESGEGVFGLSDCKPILRPLSDAKKEEADYCKTLYRLDRWGVQTLESQASVTAYLLSKHFDLFGLIESGQAIDMTKLEA